MSFHIISSVTEKSQFKDCRRKWYLSNRHAHPHAKAGQLGVEPNRPDVFFWFGDIIHSCLESYYNARQDGLSIKEAAANGRETFERIYKKKIEELEAEYGGLFNDEARAEFESYHKLGNDMLANYYAREGGEPICGPEAEILLVEKRFFHKVSEEFTLSGRFDLVVKDKDGRVWVVDHKTASQKPWLQGIELDDQLTGYSFLLTKGGMPAAGAIYNVLLKQEVNIKLLESGHVSTDKSKTKATAFHYIAFMKKNKTPFIEHRYGEFINQLLQRGWDDFFLREASLRGTTEIENYEKRLQYEAADMVAAAKNPEAAYPNPGQFKCRGCPFALPCKAMEAGDDWEQVIADGFKPRAPRL
jgi:hypothetical protein